MTSKLELPDFIDEIIGADIHITIQKDTVHGIVFDLNLNAKSHMHLYKKDAEWRVAMRYGNDWPVDSVEDLCKYAAMGMHGNPYINYLWALLMREHGVFIRGFQY